MSADTLYFRLISTPASHLLHQRMESIMMIILVEQQRYDDDYEECDFGGLGKTTQRNAPSRQTDPWRLPA